MGQQQLLLLVLGIVIVGIAVVAGIQAFSEGKAKAEQDAAVSDAQRIISDTQAWKLKPSAFGGGSSASGFTGVTLEALGYPLDMAGDSYATLNGCYALSGGTKATLTVKPLVEADTSGGSVSPASCGSASTIAEVSIAGASSDDISWSYK